MTDSTTRTYQVQYHTSGSNIDTAYVDADSYDRLEVPSSFGVDRYLAFTLDGRIVAEIRQTSVIAVVDITDLGSGDFFEEDEDPAEVAATFEAGPKGITIPPINTGLTPVRAAGGFVPPSGTYGDETPDLPGDIGPND